MQCIPENSNGKTKKYSFDTIPKCKLSGAECSVDCLGVN